MWAEKGWYVYNTLVQKADSTQKPLLTRLGELQKTGSVTSYRSYWIINLIDVTRDLDSATIMSNEASVRRVEVPPDGMIIDDDNDASYNLPTQAQQVVAQAIQDAAAMKNTYTLYKLLAPLIVQHNINEVPAPEGWTSAMMARASWSAQWIPACVGHTKP